MTLPCQIPWQGDPDNMISRYDVRVHMDYIPDYSSLPKEELSKEKFAEENRHNYERYRSLVHHTFKGDNENDVLRKLDMEDAFSEIHRRKDKDQKKVVAKSKAAIGFNYDEKMAMSSSSGYGNIIADESDSSDDEYKMDFDVDELSTRQIDKLNLLALDYGISRGFYSKSLRSEKSVLLERKDAKMMEMEKSALSGKKARKERRLFKDMLMKDRNSSPPLYVGKGSPSDDTYGRHHDSSSSDRSSTSPCHVSSNEGTMEFITEFGSNETKKSIHYTPTDNRRRSGRRDRSPSSPKHYSKRHYYRSRSRSHSNERRRRYSDRYHSPSSHDYRSRDYSSRYRSKSRSRSPSRITKDKLVPKKSVSSSSVTKQKSTEKSKLTPHERLKRKMQAQLSRTFKEDKKAEKEKAIAKEAKEIEREEHLKEETRKLRERGKYRIGDIDSIASPNSSSYT